MEPPKYAKMKLALLDRIAKSGGRPGDRLPSEREFSEIFPFSRITVRRALSDLTDEGFLERRPRSGYYVRKALEYMPSGMNMGFLSIIRKDRMPAGYQQSSLSRRAPFQQMRERGIGMIAHEEDTITSGAVAAFSDCSGILLTDWVTDDWVSSLRTLGIPLYCVGNNLCHKEKIPTIDCDYEFIVAEIIEKMIASGEKKIVLCVPDELPSGDKMEKAYREVLNRHDIPFEERRIVRMRFTTIQENWFQGLQRNEDCDAVVGGRIPDIFEYKDLGWTRIPDFISLSENTPYRGGIRPEIRLSYHSEIYDEAARILADHILLEKEIPDLTLIRPELQFCSGK